MTEEIKMGYHIRVRHTPSTAITVHAPTENWQHRPRTNPPKDGYWIGPFARPERAEQIALDLADELSYELQLCKICFSDRMPAPPTRGDVPAGIHRRGRHARAYTLPDGIAIRRSRRGV